MRLLKERGTGIRVRARLHQALIAAVDACRGPALYGFGSVRLQPDPRDVFAEGRHNNSLSLRIDNRQERLSEAVNHHQVGADRGHAVHQHFPVRRHAQAVPEVFRMNRSDRSTLPGSVVEESHRVSPGCCPCCLAGT